MIAIKITTPVTLTIATTIAKSIFAIQSFFSLLMLNICIFYDRYAIDYMITINIVISIATSGVTAIATSISG